MLKSELLSDATRRKESTMAGLVDKIQSILDDMSNDAVEERVVDYVVRELQNGRSLSEVVRDPYVKNRLNEERISRVFSDAEVVDALEEQVSSFFKPKDRDILG